MCLCSLTSNAINDKLMCDVTRQIMAIIGTGIAYMREEGLYKFWLLKMGFHGEQRLLRLFLLIVISNHNL